MIAEVAVRQAVHQAVAHGIELLGGSGLRDANQAGAGRVEMVDRDVHWRAQGGTARVGEVRHQLVESQAALSLGLEVQEVAWRASWRRGRTIQIRGQEAAIVEDGIADRSWVRRAAQHRRAVIRTKLRAIKGPATRE